MNEIPSHLYHYTSIETLALILKYKTIRFARLDLVDDPEEAETKDFGVFGRFCFSSCWTSRDEESIPMWKMYSNDLKGVRIKLPVFPLKEYSMCESTAKRRNSNVATTTKIENSSNAFYSYINPDLLSVNNFTVIPMQENILKKVIYTDEDNLIYPKVYTESGLNKSIDLKDLGVYKRKYWEFQQEYRYLFFVSPWGQEDMLNATVETLIKLFERFNYTDLPQKYLDLELDEEKFKDMTITLGPKTNEAEKVILDLLVDRFNPTAKIEQSRVKIR